MGRAKSSPKKELPEFSMPFQPMTIQHLGYRLYSTLPPVIAEFVTNAYDADSPKVEILLPRGDITPHSMVSIRDFGHGMTPEELQEQFLPIGRNRRGDDSTRVKSRSGKRDVTGRKGLGKLSGLGVADQIVVRSVRKGFAVCLALHLDDMLKWSDTHGPDEPYQPDVIEKETGPVDEKDGVEVRLVGLRRKSPIIEDDIRRGLARRLPLIGAGFQVVVNGKPIGPGDRTSKAACTTTWEVKDTPAGEKLDTGEVVSGWIGFVSKSSKTDRGVDIFATRKAVELGSFFNFPSTRVQFARAYVVGEVHANFLDSPEADLASTARNSVVWESPQGQAL